MALLTLEEQRKAHVEFLRGMNLDITELDTSAKFIRCKLIGQTQGRGEFTYKSMINEMAGGKVGIVTRFRGNGGKFETFKTYGIREKSGPTETESNPVKRARAFFFKFCNTNGTSDYLERKVVKVYGSLRFRQDEKFGNVAVVPAYNISGDLMSYQLLNGDGSKRFPKDSEVKGLFYPLQLLEGCELIGIAESYATAATVKEIVDIPMVCAFGSDNLKDVGVALSAKYPTTYFIFFADNDRHLPINKGMEKAKIACEVIRGRATLIAPQFGCGHKNSPPIRLERLNASERKRSGKESNS
jgi:hypothetical protein